VVDASARLGIMKNLGTLLRTIADVLGQTVVMADIYSLLGIVAFAAAMLGLIWTLDRV
jgi:hypothetical protein